MNVTLYKLLNLSFDPFLICFLYKKFIEIFRADKESIQVI
ncbi:unnamed protein product [Schistosoma curassoni]|uniref:Uncharacterized protein n=1 Tax=Schistosoma curassoni TaxID=6186 RepID=A0A183KA53_9TREM|nr:unnamed protein product [Schistosoma curassoni]